MNVCEPGYRWWRKWQTWRLVRLTARLTNHSVRKRTFTRTRPFDFTHTAALMLRYFSKPMCVSCLNCLYVFMFYTHNHYLYVSDCSSVQCCMHHCCSALNTSRRTSGSCPRFSLKRLCSASSTDVMVPATRRSSLGDRAFPVTGAQAWNTLLPSVTSVPSLSSFRRLLKTFLFQRQLDR